MFVRNHHIVKCLIGLFSTTLIVGCDPNPNNFHYYIEFTNNSSEDIGVCCDYEGYDVVAYMARTHDDCSQDNIASNVTVVNALCPREGRFWEQQMYRYKDTLSVFIISKRDLDKGRKILMETGYYNYPVTIQKYSKDDLLIRNYSIVYPDATIERCERYVYVKKKDNYFISEIAVENGGEKGDRLDFVIW